MLLTRIFIGILLLLPAFTQEKETLIGLDKEEVKSVMAERHKDFLQDRSVVKQQFNYLKYVNNSQTITWIIYFSDKDICTSTKKVCDYVEYDFILDELNEKYDNTGKMKWEFTTNGKKLSLELEEKDWYFTVREKMIK